MRNFFSIVQIISNVLGNFLNRCARFDRLQGLLMHSRNDAWAMNHRILLSSIFCLYNVNELKN